MAENTTARIVAEKRNVKCEVLFTRALVWLVLMGQADHLLIRAVFALCAVFAFLESIMSYEVE